MKKIILFFALSVVTLSGVYAQSAYGQLKSMAGSASVPPASKAVCAYCKSQNPYVHNAGCPYASKSVAPGVASSKTTSTSGSAVAAVSSLTGSLMTSVLSSYLSSLPGKYERQMQMNAAAQKLYGVPGGEADGFVVAVGTDGYYSIWDDNSRRWVFEEPYASTITDMILYNAHAACIQRWLGHKWGVFDVTHGSAAKSYRKAIEVFKYDSVKCVARNAPIAVGLKKGKKYRWGLITKHDVLDSWSHTVKNEWDNFDILPTVLTNFAIGHKDDKCALFAQNGSMVVQPLYDAITPVFADGTHTYFFVCMNALWGLMNELGELLVPCEYEDIKYTEEGVAVRKNGEWTIVSSRE